MTMNEEKLCPIQDNPSKLISIKNQKRNLPKKIKLNNEKKKNKEETKEAFFNSDKFNKSEEICKHLFQFRIITEHNYSLHYNYYKNYLLHIKNKFKQNFWECSNDLCRGLCPSRLLICMECLYAGCYTKNHIQQHFSVTGHSMGIDISHGFFYCFICSSYLYDSDIKNDILLSKRSSIFVDESVSLKNNSFHPYINRKFKLRCSNGLRGLLNLGSTCFMNCIIQVLVHTRPLYQYFLSKKHICKQNSSNCLVCEMRYLVHEFHSGKKTPFIPHNVLNLVWGHCHNLAGYKQQDAHEFFISTLDILHRHSSESIDSKKCNCIIDKIFFGSLQSDVVCLNCGGISTVEDPISDISLDIVKTTVDNIILNPNSLKDCLELFTRTEYLGSSAKIRCHNCESYQESTKQLSLKRAPTVITFHLKRFEQNNQLNKKISTFISFPANIDMTQFTASEIGQKTFWADCKNKHLYSLFAVVIHTGTLQTGHYVSYIKIQKAWYKCDDHKISEATEYDVLTSEAYLLFYIKYPYFYNLELDFFIEKLL